VARVEAYLPADLQELCIDAFQRSYSLNASRYFESWGDDARIFGTLVSTTGKFFVEQDLAEKIRAQEVHVSRPANSFVVAAPNCTVHYYKFVENIYGIKFDQSETKAMIPERNQLLLPLYEDFIIRSEAIKNADASSPFLHLVIAHTGDALRGLREMWVGAPSGLGRSGESPWAWVERIYKQEDDGDGRRVLLPPSPAPFTSLPLPDVSVRPRRLENEQS
jgi:hypothetical protein